MKKGLLLILSVVMIVTFSAAAFASAGEFILNGSYQLYAVSLDTGVTDTDADFHKYFQQRFRLPFAWKVNDNVTAFMRTDWTERNTNSTDGGTWGTEGMYNTTNVSPMQIDYAWVKISQPMFDLTVGMQEVFLGEGSLFDSDQEGLTLDLKFNPVTVTIAYGKLNEGNTGTALTQGSAGAAGSTSSRDDGVYADADSYAIQVKYAADNFSIGALYAMAIDRNVSFDDKKMGYGVFANATFGSWTVKGELDIFDGDQTASVKYDGMNLWADLSYKASDALTIGITGYYANGTKSANKTQLTNVSATGWSFETFDYLGELSFDKGYDTFNTALDASAFDPATNSGIQAIKGYASYKATDAITFHAVLGYATPEENVTLNSQTYVIGSVDYEWLPNVIVSVGAAYVGVDYSDNTNDDPLIQYIARLGVSF